MEHITSLILMIISEILILGLALFLRKEKKSQLKTTFNCVLLCLSTWTLCSILQVLTQNTSIDPFFWEKLAGFGVCLSPVAFLALSQVFAKTKINMKFYYLFLLIIPLTTIFLTFSNEYHHLIFQHYSINMNELLYGKYFYIHSLYSYGLYGISIYYFLRYSIKNSGFFSKQSLLIILGISIPLVLNILGTIGIIELTMYSTPISFAFLAFFFAIAIFKFKFLSIAPIAMQKIVDRMSDSFVVLNGDNIVTDFNKTFLDTFNLSSSKVRNANITDLLQKEIKFEDDIHSIKDAIKKVKATAETLYFDREFKIRDQYFNIEISNISSKGNHLGTLVLFKNVTQHILDIQTIESNQEMLMEKERLAALGQMIGGIAHNLKTPIMSVSGAAEGIHDLVNEYRSSIGDPEVTIEDHYEIAHDMEVWIDKIKTHMSYMSDVITAVKGQAVTLSSEQSVNFTIDELIKRVNILMRHELNNALITLNVHTNVDTNLELNGDVNSLVQVINNIISNAIQAYNGETNKSIDFSIDSTPTSIIFAIQDYGSGMTQEVKDKLFKEMITTKGKNGTGLGLFMSYSNIKAHFNGNMTFESEKGKGTTFKIILPLK